MIRVNKYLISKVAFPVILLLCLHTMPVSAQHDENTIKAVYIERITRFVEWPDKDNKVIHDRFVIGVYGENEFYNTLTEVFKDKSIKDLKVNVIQIKNPGQISSCNLCYLSGKAKSDIREFVNQAAASGVLLVSETPNFSEEGVHFNFYIEDEKLKFEINHRSTDLAGFKVSYLLMQNNRIIQ